MLYSSFPGRMLPTSGAHGRVEQRKLAWLITKRLQVRILSLQFNTSINHLLLELHEDHSGAKRDGLCVCRNIKCGRMCRDKSALARDRVQRHAAGLCVCGNINAKEAGGKNLKEFAQKFYRSKKWKSCRSAYITERTLVDGGLCEVCRERTGFIVHHKISLDSSNVNMPEISLNHSNLMYVCKECHDKFEGHFEASRGRARKAREITVQFDENGDPSPVKREK